jgi:uncharacterized protein YcbX
MYVGKVQALWRFPVKSMAGEQLPEADLTWSGLAGDRKWAFVRPGQQRNGFPWLTIRQQPVMHRYRPVLVDPETPDRSLVRVATPAGATLDIDDPALAAELGDGVSVLRQNRGIPDAAPVALISVQSVAALSRRVGTDLDAARFRANLVVDAPGGAEFPEDDWVGRSLEIGSAVLRIDERDPRCCGPSRRSATCASASTGRSSSRGRSGPATGSGSADRLAGEGRVAAAHGVGDVDDVGARR